MTRAILWDMDGVLVNSMEFHYQAYREVLSQYGRDLSREEYLTSLIGLRNYVILRRLLGDLPQEEVERLMAAKEAAFRHRRRKSGRHALHRRHHYPRAGEARTGRPRRVQPRRRARLAADRRHLDEIRIRPPSRLIQTVMHCILTPHCAKSYL